MREEKGMGIIQIILLSIIIIIICIFAYKFIRSKIKSDTVVDIKANMLLIQGKCKVLGQTSKANNNKDGLKGKKVSEMKDDNIISEFLSKNLIEEDKQENYYVLSDEDLESMGLEVKNEKKSYYIVNYETYDVFITKGYTDIETNEVIYKSE